MIDFIAAAEFVCVVFASIAALRVGLRLVLVLRYLGDRPNDAEPPLVILGEAEPEAAPPFANWEELRRAA